MIEGLHITVSGAELKDWLERTAKDAERHARVQAEVAQSLEARADGNLSMKIDFMKADVRYRELEAAAKGAAFFARYVEIGETYRISLKELVDLRLESLTR